MSPIETLVFPISVDIHCRHCRLPHINQRHELPSSYVYTMLNRIRLDSRPRYACAAKATAARWFPLITALLRWSSTGTGLFGEPSFSTAQPHEKYAHSTEWHRAFHPDMISVRTPCSYASQYHGIRRGRLHDMSSSNAVNTISSNLKYHYHIQIKSKTREARILQLE